MREDVVARQKGNGMMKNVRLVKVLELKQIIVEKKIDTPVDAPTEHCLGDQMGDPWPV